MKSWLKALAAYGGAAVLALLLVVWALRLWKADLTVPFCYWGDGLWMQMWVKAVIEEGWYLHNSHLAAPFGMDMHDFPLSDSLFFLLLKGLALITHDSALTLNVFFLLTFPLIALTTLFVLRRFGLSFGPALLASLLFAFLPYHFTRGVVHLFLASYFLIPLAALVILWVYLGEGPFFRRDERGDLRWDLLGGRTLGGVAVCVLLGCGGVYYAFFTCYLLLVAGVASSCRLRRVHPLTATVLLVGIISLGVLANLAPTFLYHRAHGPNPHAVFRHPTHPELLALKLGHLLMPLTGHRLGWLARQKVRYNLSLTGGFNENAFSSLGLLGTLGVLYLGGRLLTRRPSARGRVQDGLTVLVLFAVLLGVTGGLGPLVSSLLTPWIRCYNRVSVFIAFFALFAVALVLDRCLRVLPSARSRFLFQGLLALLLIGGVLDQTVPSFIPPYAELKAAYEKDAAFVRRIEASVPAGTRVFQLPLVLFPEGGPVKDVDPYDHFRPYLHSRTLSWSFGSMRGREGDVWNAWVSELPEKDLVRTLVCAGFGGIWLDRAGYPDRGAALEVVLTGLLGEPPLNEPGGRLAFFNLGRYAEKLRGQAAPGTWVAWQEAALHPVAFAWRGTFYPLEKQGADRWHPSGPFSAVMLANLSGRPRKVTLSMTCSTEGPGPAGLVISSPLWNEKLTIDGHGQALSHTLVLPAGLHALQLTCDGRPAGTTSEGYPRVFRVANFTLRYED